MKNFYDLLCAIAHQLWLDGDTDPLGVRKIKAIALITAIVTGQAALDPASVLGTTATSRPASRRKIRLNVLVEADDCDVDAEGGAAFAVGTIESSARPPWPSCVNGSATTTSRSCRCLNMARRDAVDQHDPPAWMRELVELRDGHCVFPRCTVPAKACDKDHITAYLPLDDGGPPGQTHPDALACLCRRHHRAKTARVWRYTRTPACGCSARCRWFWRGGVVGRGRRGRRGGFGRVVRLRRGEGRGSGGRGRRVWRGWCSGGRCSGGRGG